MKFILGKKINMTQLWDNDKVVSVTRVQAGPCIITQVKDENTDNYKAIQLAYGERKPKNISKPVRGHLKKAGIEKENSRYLREFRVSEIKPEMKTGGIVDVSIFSKGDIVDVVGTSKGKGFQGVVKRHGFSGSKKTHGNKDQLRASGSIGALGPAHVFKGTRMGGRMGGDCITMKNLEIVDVDLENNILFIKGAVPGCESGLLMIKGKGELIIKDENQKKVEEVKETNNEEVKDDKEADGKNETPKKEEVATEKVEKQDEEKTGEEAKKTEENLSEK